MDAHDVIISPVISEKSHDAITENKFTFKVAPRATKTQIKMALKEIFDVDAEKVNIINVSPKWKRMGRFEGRTSVWKKAIVTLPKNQKIPGFFEGM